MYISYIHISYVIYVISLSISVYVWDYKYSGDGEATAQQIQRLKVDVFVVSHLFLLHCKMLWPRCTFVKSCKLALPNLTRNMSVVSTITPGSRSPQWILAGSEGIWPMAHVPGRWALMVDEFVDTIARHQYMRNTFRTRWNDYILYITGWWFGTWILFFHILGIIIPTDELIFFRGVGQPLMQPVAEDSTALRLWATGWRRQRPMGWTG